MELTISRLNSLCSIVFPLEFGDIVTSKRLMVKETQTALQRMVSAVFMTAKWLMVIET